MYSGRVDEAVALGACRRGLQLEFFWNVRARDKVELILGVPSLFYGLTGEYGAGVAIVIRNSGAQFA